MDKNFYSLRVKRIKKETSKAVSILVEIPEDKQDVFRYKSGQYLTILKEIAGDSIRRAYSISSAPHEDGLEVGVKKVENGLMSSYLVDQLKEGDQLMVMPPQGNFVNSSSSESLVLFAAGSGITPIISILKTALLDKTKKVFLHYGNYSEEETIYKSELDELLAASEGRLWLKYYYSKDQERIGGEGTETFLSSYSAELKNASYFICGPNTMMDEIKNVLQGSGVSSQQIHIEYFKSTSASESEGSTKEISGDVADVKLIIDGETYEVRIKDHETILEAGERMGIDLPFSCHSGICTTCKAKLIQGNVEMENNLGLDQEDIDEGYVLTCIGKPTSPGVIVNWDEA